MRARKSPYNRADVRRTLRKHAARLLAHRNVLYLAVGEKIAAGTGQKRLAIRVCVSMKAGPDYPRRVPVRLKAVRANGSLASYYIPTDVQKKPRRLKALALRGGDPIAGVTRGSVGLVFQNDIGQSLILTNAHVSPGVNALAQGQRVNDLSGRAIGRTHKATRLSSAAGTLHSVDAAVLMPTVPVDPFLIAGHPTPVVQFKSLAEGMPQNFFYLLSDGARCVFRHPEQIATSRPVTMQRHSLEFVNFFEMTQTGGSRRPKAGDSGSVILSDRGDGLVAHAILFAGEGDTIGVISIDDAFSALK